MGTKDDLHRIERELERSHKQVSDVSAPETARPLLPPAKASKPHSSLDLILGLAAALAVVGLGVNTVRQMPDQQAKTLRDGLIGSAAGLLVGYGVGRFRP
jgi:capsular polysaccharide biosynthesis protein